MSDQNFEQMADEMLGHIESALEDLQNRGGPNFDFELKPGGVLEIEFDDGSKIIVNRHGAAREIWLAVRSGGYHFRHDGNEWIDTRGGEALLLVLARCMSEQARQAIIFN